MRKEGSVRDTFLRRYLLLMAGRADEEREGSLHSRALEALGMASSLDPHDTGSRHRLGTLLVRVRVSLSPNLTLTRTLSLAWSLPIPNPNPNPYPNPSLTLYPNQARYYGATRGVSRKPCTSSR